MTSVKAVGSLAYPEGGRGFLCNTGPDPLKKRKATKPAFNVGPSSARQRNAILMVFRWQADDGHFIAVFGSSSPHQLKQNKRKRFWIRG